MTPEQKESRQANLLNNLFDFKAYAMNQLDRQEAEKLDRNINSLETIIKKF